MSVSHGFHAIAIMGLAILTTDPSLSNNHGGNLGYVFILAMTATSFSSTAALLGTQNWKILHTVGMYYLWLAFIYSFSHRLEESILNICNFKTRLELEYNLSFGSNLLFETSMIIHESVNYF